MKRANRPKKALASVCRSPKYSTHSLNASWAAFESARSLRSFSSALVRKSLRIVFCFSSFKSFLNSYSFFVNSMPLCNSWMSPSTFSSETIKEKKIKNWLCWKSLAVLTSCSLLDKSKFGVKMECFGEFLVDCFDDVMKQAQFAIARLCVDQRVERLEFEPIGWSTFSAVKVVTKSQNNFQKRAQLFRCNQRARRRRNRLNLLKW